MNTTITKEIINKANEMAKSHIKLVTETGFDDKWESDPYDHWDNVDGFDVNFVGVPVLDDDGDDTDEYTWRCAIYTGQYDSKGYWSTNYSDGFPFYVVGGEKVKFLALTIDRLSGKTHWTPTKNSLDDLIAHFERYPSNGKEVLVYWLDNGAPNADEEQLQRTCIEL